MEQRRQAMNSKEYNKKIADARRNESRKFGFRQSSYINFKVEAGYFFCLYFLTEEARLTVKPMYADELWWDIWNATENKNEPLSLRGTGAYSLSGQVLASYKIAPTADIGVTVAEHAAVKHTTVFVLPGILYYCKNFFLSAMMDKCHKVKQSVGVMIHFGLVREKLVSIGIGC